MHEDNSIETYVNMDEVIQSYISLFYFILFFLVRFSTGSAFTSLVFHLDPVGTTGAPSVQGAAQCPIFVSGSSMKRALSILLILHLYDSSHIRIM